MKNTFWDKRRKEFFLKIAEFSFSNYKIILLVTLIVLLISLPLLKGLQIDTDFIRLIDSDKPLFKTYAENKKLFGGKSPLIIFFKIDDLEEVELAPLINELASSISKWEDVLLLSHQPLQLSHIDLAGMILRAALLNSNSSNFQLFLSRFNPDAISREVQKTRRKLITVSDPELRKQINIDVLNVFPLIESFFRSRTAPQLFNTIFQGNGHQSQQIFFLQPKGPSEDSDYCIGLLSRLNTLCDQLIKKYELTQKLNVQFAGVHAITAQSTGILKREMLIIALVSFMLLFLVLSLSLRKIRMALICFIPLTISVFFTLLVARLFFNPIYFITIGLTAIVLGLGLDIGLHLSARLTGHLRNQTIREAICKTFIECGPPVFIGILSTVTAFAALIVTGKPGITQFAVLTIIGLILTLIFTFLLFPALIRLLITEKKAVSYKGKIWIIPSMFFELLVKYYRISFIAGLILLLISIPFAMKISLDISITNLFPKNLDVLHQVNELENKLNSSFTSTVQVSIEAPTLDQALISQHKIEEKLTKGIKEGKIAFFDSFTSLFPFSADPDILSHAEALIKSQREAFFAILKKNGFRLNENHRRYYDILERSMQFSGMSLQEIRDFPELAQFIAPVRGGIRLQTLIWPSMQLTKNSSFSSRSATAIDEMLKHITFPDNQTLVVTNTASLLEKINVLVKEQFLRISWFAFILVLLCVWFFFRNVKKTVLCLIPLVAAIPLLLASIVIFDIPITPASIAFGAVIFGIGIDDAIHILARVNENQDGSLKKVYKEIGPVITLTTISTAMGFGSLMLSSHPVVSSIGQAIAIGVVACWIFTMFLLPALISWKGIRIFRLGLFLFFVLFSVTMIHGDQQKAEKIFTKLRNKMASTEAVSCSFSQTKRIQQLEGSIQLTGNMLFQKPRFLKLEIRGDVNINIYVNKETVTIVDLDLSEVEKYRLEKLIQSDHWMSPMMMIFEPDKLDSKFELSLLKVPRQEILHLVPKNKQHNLRSIDLRIDEFQRVRWSRVRYKNGDMVDTIFRKWKKLKKIPERTFQYKKGVLNSKIK